MPRPRKDSPPPVVIPPLQSCATCGLPVQAGDFRGTAFHDCAFVLQLKEAVGQLEPPPLEQVRSVLLRRIRDAALVATPKEAVDLLRALREYEGDERATGGGGGGDDDEFGRWASGGAARPW